MKEPMNLELPKDLEIRYLVLKIEDIESLTEAEKITFWHLVNHVFVNAGVRKGSYKIQNTS